MIRNRKIYHFDLFYCYLFVLNAWSLELKKIPKFSSFPNQCFQYCFDFMTTKIFQFVSCLYPTPKDLKAQVHSEEVIMRG